MADSHMLHSVFGIFGIAFGFFLFLAPTITFKRIIANRATEQFSGIPYIMALLNCLLSAWYGMPFVSPHNISVAVTNCAGTVIESIYVLIFLCFAPKKEKAKMFGLLVTVLSLFSAVAIVSLFALHGAKRNLVCGLATSLCSIMMYAAPLSVMRMVIKTKSVEYMPFCLSLFVFLCGTSWFLFGLIGNDPFVYVPNGIGCGFGAMQLVIYFIYRNEKGDNEAKKVTNDVRSMEMGLAKPYQKTHPKGQMS